MADTIFCNKEKSERKTLNVSPKKKMADNILQQRIEPKNTLSFLKNKMVDNIEQKRKEQN